jgi:hypothetical protein
MLGAAPLAMPQVGPWTKAHVELRLDQRTLPGMSWLSDFHTYRLDTQDITSTLARAPHESSPFARARAVEIPVPMPDGTIQRFLIVESPIMTEQLARRIDVKTYAGRGLDDRYASIRLSVSPYGFHGYVMSPNGDVMIDPVSLDTTTEYVSYFKANNMQPRNFRCFTVGEPLVRQRSLTSDPRGDGDSVGGTLKTYRLAMNTTGEYTTFFGSVANAQNRVAISVNRVTGIYERDIAIRLNMTYVNCYPNASTDPFSNWDLVAMLGQNQSDMDAKVGNANYDVGHVFGTGDGGVANLGVVGVTGWKARGVTGSSQPFGDLFDVDYVAHEMGHQFGAHHTFAGTVGGCSGQGTSSSAYEPGSGSTIMAYAGLCGSQNVQNFSDPYFHTRSFDQIFALRQNPSSGGTTTNNGNAVPNISAGANYTIPRQTPFKLTAIGSHPLGHPLTYCWEQFNLGTTDTTRPLFRSRNPITSPTRFMPRIEDVLANAATPWELLPTVDRSMTFRVTARDNQLGGGGSAHASMTVTVSGLPFQVTSPNTNVTWTAGSTQTVTWQVGGGSVALNVNILLSTNGGSNYATGGAIMLKANTPNDGSEPVTVPFVTTTTARIIVEPVNNIFYDVSNVNFSIVNPVPVANSLSPNSAAAGSGGLTLTVNGSGFVPTSVVRWNGANRTTTFVSSSQLTATIPASDLTTAGSATVTVFSPTPGGGTSAGLTFTINQSQTTVLPTGFNVIFGTITSGNLQSLFESDDQRLEIFQTWLRLRSDPAVSLTVDATAPTATPGQFTFRLEAHSTAVPTNHVPQRIEMFNYVTNTWETLDQRVTPNIDQVVEVAITSNPSRFIRSSDRAMRARLSWFDPGTLEFRDWRVRIDQAIWRF